MEDGLFHLRNLAAKGLMTIHGQIYLRFKVNYVGSPAFKYSRLRGQTRRFLLGTGGKIGNIKFLHENLHYKQEIPIKLSVT